MTRPIRTALTLGLTLVASLWLGCQPKPTAKYVFLFIGDGMGTEHINLTEAYLSATQGIIGNSPLNFTLFPTLGISTTYAQDQYITCSAAAGTSLASGAKTSVGTIGLTHCHSDSLFSIAHRLHRAGYPVGIATTVSLDHATPAAFYAHQPSRNRHHEIAHDLIASGFRVFAGGSFLDPSGEASQSPRGDVFEVGRGHGVSFTHTLPFPDSLLRRAGTIVYTPKGNAPELPYRIDSESASVSLAHVTEAAIQALYNPKGFFFLVEGGKIDWAGHDNDAATVIGEVMGFADAVAVALRFYEQHPEHTLIVVTSDHATGGLSIGNNSLGYSTYLELLQNQRASRKTLAAQFHAFTQGKGGRPTFDQSLGFLRAHLGLGSPGLELRPDELQRLQQAYHRAMTLPDAPAGEDQEYGPRDYLVREAIAVLNSKAGVGWTTTAHTGSKVPLYAIGVGHELFGGRMDNTEIPRRIARAMGLER